MDYTGTENISEYGVYAGRFKSNPAYVGQVNISGVLVPGIIRSKSMLKYCIDIGDDYCEDEFQHLYRTEDNNYEWIASRNGENVENSVSITNIFGSFVIGRAHQNGRYSLGLVYPGHGLSINEKSKELRKLFTKRHEVIYDHFIKNNYQSQDTYRTQQGHNKPQRYLNERQDTVSHNDIYLRDRTHILHNLGHSKPHRYLSEIYRTHQGPQQVTLINI